MADDLRNLNHMYLHGVGEVTPYKRPGGGGSALIPRDRRSHADFLEQTYIQAVESAKAQPREKPLQIGRQGYYLQFELKGKDASKDVLQGFDDDSAGIELASVHIDTANKRTLATVIIPDDTSETFLNKIRAYKTRSTQKGRPQYGPLMTHIDAVSRAALRSIFVGDQTAWPDPVTHVWWEVWLRRGGIDDYRRIAQRLELPLSARAISFPEREVVLTYASINELTRVFLNSTLMTELRLSLDTPQFFIELPNDEQRDWVDNTAERLLPPDDKTVASVLLLDSGVNRGHPLIAPFLSEDDCQAWNPDWGVGDMRRYDGHGTAMAGLALHGDLMTLLQSTAVVQPTHWLESVKILPPFGHNAHEQYGLITKDAIRIMESIQPHRWRVICLAVTANKDFNRGRPTAWSSAIDQLASGVSDIEPESQRLIVISAGNSYTTPEPTDLITDYLGFADTSQVHSPAQAWNALTVGAFTNKDQVLDVNFNGWHAVANVGDLSPSSSTSTTWADQWPIKPDIVLEGGNIISNGVDSCKPHPDVRLLTTDYAMSSSHFRDFGDTSGASALAAQMAAQLASENPHFWPETVRGLMIHSADWTPAMLSHRTGSKVKGAKKLLRRYGYGVPDLERAKRSAQNDWTLIIQDELYPFLKDKDENDFSSQMHLHKFPWSSIDIDALEGIELEMRITLSYFIEPNPSERGFAQRFRYASHGLRFAVKGPLEKERDFKARVQNETRRENEDIRDAGNSYWEFGPTMRTTGSVHTDRWRGDIITLRGCDSVLVHPVVGWWRQKQGAAIPYWERMARYSLIVSLRSPGVEVDIYTPVATELGIGINVTV